MPESNESSSNSWVKNFIQPTVQYKAPAFSYANAAQGNAGPNPADKLNEEEPKASVKEQDSNGTNVDPKEEQDAIPKEPTTEHASDAQPSDTNTKLVDTLVVDTNPLVKGIRIDHLSKKFVTTPEVLSEVRSRGAKELLESTLLKLNLSVIEPDAESIDFVVRFAKKTGDYASLAVADIKVIALAYMLEKQKNGVDHLRAEPKKSAPTGSIKVAKKEEPKVDDLAEDIEKLDIEDNAGDDKGDVKSIQEDGEEEKEEVENKPEYNNGDGDDNNDGWEVVTKKKTSRKQKTKHFNFGGNWITPQNLKQQQARDGANISGLDSKGTPSKPMDVACVTADFAMQNVLLQIGLHLLSPDGIIVKRLKTWIQRCQACFKLVPEMERKFCPSCGHAALSRVAVSVNDQGETKVFLKHNYQYRLQGTKFAIPKAKGGRANKDIILREDDKQFQDNMHKWKVHQTKLSKQNQGGAGVFDLDYIPSMWLGASTNNSLTGPNKNIATYNQVELDTRGLPVVGFGRKNPNIVRKTGNRKNKKK
ncbi:20S-pre-rRNA D-site endonuclease nob1 [Mycoemilia scoparia]|uniref:20S-pre-rRNA D-site endonuclease NOB1 n=1 Tax=Mycoemilia scoparia TaxID=417184 RepID=A0A9W8DRM3_9FUNG|nr:20S-pre-rRNA D-site endonuclease nob1 [Mycoemilia scoparia]